MSDILEFPDYMKQPAPEPEPEDKLDPESPNSDIDALIKHLIKRAKSKEKKDQLPPDTIVKILNTAINWEKVKHKIMDVGDEGFNPEEL